MEGPRRAATGPLLYLFALIGALHNHTSSPTGSHWSAVWWCFETETTAGWKTSPPQICYATQSLLTYQGSIGECFGFCVGFGLVNGWMGMF